MNRNDLFVAMGFIDDKIIENSEVNRTVKKQKKYSKRTFLLVAILCMLTVFATAAVAAKLLSLRATLIDTPDPEIISGINLSGFTDSNEYKAAAEWISFAESYDPDGSLLAQADPEGPNDTVLDEKYAPYPVYTQEMADKLDAIAAKYGLVLHGSPVPEKFEALVANLIINDYTEFSDKAHNTMLAGHMYDDGSFGYDGTFDASFGRLSVYYQFLCSVKGVFDPIFLNIGDIEDYQEQVIVTESGIELVAAISGYKSVLIAEFDSCFVTINVMGGTDEGITFDDLEDLANTFDFSVIEGRKDEPAQDTQGIAADKSAGGQRYIEISREGIVEQLPVETVHICSFDATMAMAPAFFTHTVREGIDTFTYTGWTGEREVYYSVYHVSDSSPNQICEKLFTAYGEKYAGKNVFAVKVGDHDATTVQFESESASPSYQRHFFIIPTDGGSLVIEAQFDFEMYEGLFRIMLALFETLKIG